MQQKNLTKIQNVDFSSPQEQTNSYYDLFEDWALIEASFASQYHIRLRRETDMTWGEFSALLSGLLPDTPLGEIVSIRNENNPEILDKFTPAQKKIHDDWQKKQLQKHPELYQEKLKQIEKLFFQFGEVNQNAR